MTEQADLVLIGGGIVGAATAFQFARRQPGLKIVVLEKEDAVACHQTGHNSGVIHSGLYYKPGSARAKNCVRGRALLLDFAREHGIPHEICGKLVIATRRAEFTHLSRIYRRGLENGLRGLKRLDREGIRAIEPEAGGIRGLHVPETGIIDFPAVNRKLIELFQCVNGENRVHYHREALGFVHGPDTTRVLTNQDAILTKNYVVCAGLHADRLALADGLPDLVRIVPFRGDYHELKPTARRKVRNLIYPVPDPRFPFLGVHLTRMVDSIVECGPNAVFSFKREGYGKFDFSWRDLFDSLSFPGTLLMFAKNWRYGAAEYVRAFSPRLFLRDLRRLVPSLTLEDLEPGRSGVRASALGRDGSLIDDFKIEKTARGIHVLNAPSPAATACLAIGETIVEMAQGHFHRHAR